MLYTERLILRNWEESDAEDLYKYAKNPAIGPIAGWQPHKDAEESRNIIKNVLNGDEAYAVCLKNDNKPIGAIELMLCGRNHMSDEPDECELGYWVAEPFWGQGLIPEAARELLRHAFDDLGMSKVWCGYYDGNTKSKRVQEKVGFTYQYTKENVDVPLMGEKRTEHISAITKEEWKKWNTAK
ncbi:MAG: GNAT family N-acetyltransferase [Eubacterium sp.]|nr:GNAT family N-acetyltransferase [Eubacterium sp.]